MLRWKPIKDAPKDIGILVGKRQGDEGYYIDFVVKDEKGFCYDMQNKLYLAYEPDFYAVINKPNF